jgi:hypothetical protein
VCIAAANRIGQRAVSRVLVSGALADPDVRDLLHVVERVGGDRLTRQRRPGRGADELQGGRGRHHPDTVPGLGQPAEQITDLVGRDPAADTENDGRPLLCGHRPEPGVVIDG